MCMHRWMCGRMGGCVDDGCVDGWWMGGRWICGWMGGCLDDGFVNGWVDVLMMDGWMDEYCKVA